MWYRFSEKTNSPTRSMPSPLTWAWSEWGLSSATKATPTSYCPGHLLLQCLIQSSATIKPIDAHRPIASKGLEMSACHQAADTALPVLVTQGLRETVSHPSDWFCAQ